MLRCSDLSVYTGITTDVKRRFSEHESAGRKGARYTRVHKPVSLIALWRCEGRSAALKLEYRIKTLKKEQKERLAAGGELSAFCGGLCAEEYERLECEGDWKA